MRQQPELTVEEVPTDELVPYARNATILRSDRIAASLVLRSGVLRTGLGALEIQRLAVDVVTSLVSRAIRSIALA